MAESAALVSVCLLSQASDEELLLTAAKDRVVVLRRVTQLQLEFGVRAQQVDHVPEGANLVFAQLGTGWSGLGAPCLLL